MIPEDVAKELKVIKDRINRVETQLSTYFEALHNVDASEIADNREGIMELYEMISE